MKYTRKDYEAFLSTELETQMREYARLVETKAIVLKERGDVFVGRFIKLQENGMVIFKVRVNDNMPRKNTFWTASYFINEMGSYKNWGELSWAELRKQYQRVSVIVLKHFALGCLKVMKQISVWLASRILVWNLHKC